MKVDNTPNAMSPRDIERLSKVMAVSTSDKDGEALAAVRIANGMLERAGYRWEHVFACCAQVPSNGVRKNGSGRGRTDAAQAQYAAAQRAYQEAYRYQREAEIVINDKINRAFDIVFEKDPSGGFRDFLDSLFEQWTEKGRLSAKQRDALFKCAERNKGASWAN